MTVTVKLKDTGEHLFMAEEAAGKLGISVKTLMKHVNAGSIRFINIGTKKRRQLRFTQSNIDTFIQAKKHKEVPACPSTKTLEAHIGGTSLLTEAVSRYYFRCRHQNQKASRSRRSQHPGKSPPRPRTAKAHRISSTDLCPGGVTLLA